MQEFSSVTASSYDAESLAPLLTEKAAEGWEIVSIVAAGTNIVAYLRRGDAHVGGSGTDDAVVSGVAAASIAAAGASTAADAAPEADLSDHGMSDAAEPAATSDTGYAPTLPGDDAPYVPAEAAITAEAPVTDVPQSFGTDDASSVVAVADEPAGWAAAPDNDLADLAAQVGADDAAGVATDNFDAGIAAAGAGAAAAGAGAIGGAGDSMGDLASQAADTASGAADSVGDAVGGVVDQATDATSGAAEHAGAAVSAVTDHAADTGAGAAAAVAESTVPAGWYADPSGRYELRYWDGTAWTEHVSRAGQQFTDPPVA